MALSKIVENSITDGVVSSAKLKDFAAAVDLNGVELILDADQDTSITADTDDRIDFKIANVEHFSFSNSSGDTVVKPMVDAKDIIFQQYDGNKILEINDGNFVGIGGNASAPGEIRIYEDTDNGSHYTGFKAGNNTASVAYVLPTADGSASQALVTDGSGTLSWSTISTAYDDLTAGDAALNITTTAGNITIDAQGNDTDIIFKGTDGGADRTYMTIDGSAGGDLFLTGGLIDLKNDGSAVSQIKFYCESSNAHAQTLIGAPHSESATNTLTLPSTGGNSYLLTAASTATVTNKTFTSPKINEDVALTATATELNLLDGVSGLVQADLTKLAAIDATAAEINLIDGGTARGTTALASGDGILINDAGTMRMTDVDTVKTFMQTGISTAYDDLTAGDAAVLITTSSGNITIDAAADDSDIIFKGTDGGADTTFLTIDGSAAGAATFNDKIIATELDISGNIDVDGTANLDVVDIDGAVDMASTLQVDGAITSSAGATITTADNLNTLSLISTDADADAGPNLRMYRNSGSPADNDDMGRISFDGRNDNSQDYVAARIWAEASDVSDGTEDAALLFDVMKAGTVNNMLNLNPSEIVFNEAGVDVDFRLESDSNTHAFFVQGSDGNVGIGVVPETTYSTWQAVQIAGTGNLFGERSQAADKQIVLGQNVYMDAGGDFTHLITDEASYYRQYAGTHAFFVAGSGSADATLSTSKALEIKNNGKVEINADGLGTNFGGAAASIGHSSTSPILELHVNHTSAFGAVKLMNGNGEVGSISITGSGVTFNTSSDYRLKENVDYTWDATTRLKQLKPARFNFIADDTNTLVDGFIAHEVSSVVPEAVSGVKDAMNAQVLYAEGDELPEGKSVGDVKTAATIAPQGIDQSKLVPLLVKTIQELEARITALEG